MHGQCMVAVYRSRDDAKKACKALVDAGISDDRMRLSDAEIHEHEVKGGTMGHVESEPSGRSPYDWLFGSKVPEDERRAYDDHTKEGGAALSVYVEDGPSLANTDVVEDILERYEPVDLKLEDGVARKTTTTRTAAPTTAPRTETKKGERVIPLPEEELKVGKRASERVQHIRTYPVEKPVEKDVHLHDERTVIEKRPASGATRSSVAPGAREYEIREHHEEPVVEKSTRAGEELVVKKEGANRTERVRDTVRKTEVDAAAVDKKVRR